MVGELIRRRRDVLEQGEVFATIGLAWVLRGPGARTAFASLLGANEALEWSADVPVPGGRVDLLGQADAAQSATVVKAKIHHALGREQLVPYGKWLLDAFPRNAGAAIVGILVPDSRRREAAEAARDLQTVVPVLAPVVTGGCLRGAGLSSHGDCT